MAYSLEEEQEAQEKLAEIWRISTRREKLAIADRFEYGGSDASKLRVMRRLLTGSIGDGQYINVTNYFKSYVTHDSPNAWDGKRVPPFAIEGNAQIMSQIMYVREFDISPDDTRNTTLQAYEVHLNADAKSNDIRTLFEAYNRKVKEVLGRYSKIDPNSDHSSTTLAIAFSQEGVEELINLYDKRIKDPRPDTPYGIIVASTRSKYVGVKGKMKRAKPNSKTFQRSFPKTRLKKGKGKNKGRIKRDAMIEFANRSHAGHRKKGGRLA